MPTTDPAGRDARAGSYLVVANQTADSDELVRAIQERAAAAPSEFWIVVPATPVNDLAGRSVPLTPMPVMGGVLSVPGDPEEARSLAADRLRAALARLRAEGLAAEGEVGDPDPVRAVEMALGQRKFDELIVSTLPERRSRWLHQDLPRRLEHSFRLPVTHVEATDTRAR